MHIFAAVFPLFHIYGVRAGATCCRFWFSGAFLRFFFLIPLPFWNPTGARQALLSLTVF